MSKLTACAAENPSLNISVIQSMIDAIDKPAIFITTDYVIQAVNEAYEATYQTDIRLGRDKCHQISHRSEQPCDRHGEDCPLLHCQKTQRATSVVHIHTLADGKSYCDILMKPIKDDDGMVIGFLEILGRIQYASASSQKNKMIGQSKAFRSMLNKINKAAQSDISVLLQGETGSGKELVAQAVHQVSKRADKPFVVIECTGLSENLFESELFGYEKGAFTGAGGGKKGLIELANGGTVFFDEIGDVPLNIQVKLLRLLETRSFRAVGGLTVKRVEFRMICASHKNLLELVEQGSFRKDLYFRIAAFPIELPSLAQRKEDIPQLARHFLKHSEHRHKRFGEQALLQLARHDFPGNIRELKNIVEHAALLADEDEISVSDLPPLSQLKSFGDKAQVDSTEPGAVVPLERLESDYLSNIARTFEGSAEELAQLLGVSLRTLYRKLQRYGIRLS